jgi:hypothetical protein
MAIFFAENVDTLRDDSFLWKSFRNAQMSCYIETLKMRATFLRDFLCIIFTLMNFLRKFVQKYFTVILQASNYFLLCLIKI